MDIIAEALGSWASEFNTYSCLLKIALCVIMSMIAGTERATKLHSAGIKTFIFVGLAGLSGALGDSYILSRGGSFSLITPAVIIGVAIISTNTILFSSKNQLRGLTTSVGLWCVGIISALIGFGLYFVGIVVFVLFMLVIVFLPKFEKRMKQKSAYIEAHIELKSRDGLQVFTGALRQLGLKINDIEINPAYVNSGLAVYSMSMRIVNPDLKGKNHKELLDAVSSMETVVYAEEIF